MSREDRVIAAQRALNDSDQRVIRALESLLPQPVRAYRAALRAWRANPDGEMPAAPDWSQQAAALDAGGVGEALALVGALARLLREDEISIEIGGEVRRLTLGDLEAMAPDAGAQKEAGG